jgi:hypothetical protein
MRQLNAYPACALSRNRFLSAKKSQHFGRWWRFAAGKVAYIISSLLRDGTVTSTHLLLISYVAGVCVQLTHPVSKISATAGAVAAVVHVPQLHQITFGRRFCAVHRLPLFRSLILPVILIAIPV